MAVLPVVRDGVPLVLYREGVFLPAVADDPCDEACCGPSPGGGEIDDCTKLGTCLRHGFSGYSFVDIELTFSGFSDAGCSTCDEFLNQTYLLSGPFPWGDFIGSYCGIISLGNFLPGGLCLDNPDLYRVMNVDAWIVLLQSPSGAISSSRIFVNLRNWSGPSFNVQWEDTTTAAMDELCETRTVTMSPPVYMQMHGSCTATAPSVVLRLLPT